MTSADRPIRVRRVHPWLLGVAWTSPWLVGLVVFLAVPVLLSLIYGFTEYSLIEPPIPVGAANYREMLGDGLFWRVLANTLLYTVLAVGIGTVLSLGIAVALEQRVPGSDLVRAVVFLPTVVPVVAASLAWAWMFSAESGLINTLLAHVGIRGPDWLGDGRWAMLSVVIVGLWGIGSQVVIYAAALRDVPRQLYDAAAIDGATPIGRFFRITLPQISPTVLFNVVMSIIWSIQVFAAPLIMTKGGPDNATLVYSLYVYRNAFEYGRMGYASALAWVQFLVALILTGMALWLGRRLVHYRGAS
ncbi:MAG: sugar ABC transporter permease [Phycisphaeraceae bacterium]|nr:sugar ABC transporter permease [Phycisphaeraceae bacterium]